MVLWLTFDFVLRPKRQENLFIDFYSSSIGVKKPRETFEQTCFARAVRPDQPEQFAMMN
jgi:hypothetical protein